MVGADDRRGHRRVRSSQASATCAGGTPRRSATSAIASTIARSRLAVEASPNSSVSRAARSPSSQSPGQPAAGERAPRDHADALVGAERQHLPLLLAVDQVVVVLHRDERVQPCRSATCSALANCQANIEERRCSGPCPPSRRRGAPPSSPRSASRSPSGGSGRGRRSRCRAGAGCASISDMIALRESPRAVGSVAHRAADLGRDHNLVATASRIGDFLTDRGAIELLVNIAMSFDDQAIHQEFFCVHDTAT